MEALRPLLAVAICLAATILPAQQAPFSSSPPRGDDSAPSLRAYEQALLARFGPHYRDVPLDVKAEFFEWAMFRYQHLPGAQVYDWSILADRPGVPPTHIPGSDTSTWNGALLCGLSYKYAVTKDPRTLEHIADVLCGMRLCLDVTGKRGHIVRSVIPADGVHHKEMQPCTTSDGRPHYCWADPAKGTYNQILGGYAKVMMHAWPDLPPDVQRMCHDDLTSLVLHVIDHDYHLTDKNGRRTTYGDLTPILGSFGVPFNAQVAYQIVAAGHAFPPRDEAERRRIGEQFQRLRNKHHVYYEDPWNVVRPQMVVISPFIQHNNDRAHAMFAAFTGLELDIRRTRREKLPLDAKFLERLGQTMLWGMTAMERYPHALSHLSWASFLGDEEAFNALVRHKRNTVRGQMERCLLSGIDELTCYKLDRFDYPGREHDTGQPQHVDQFRPGYRWNQRHTTSWEVTGPASNRHYSAFCYLHAYWLMRYYRLDEHPLVARQNLAVLRSTGFRID
jgi:hypothetical protein